MLFGQPVSLIWRTEQWKRKKFFASGRDSPWGSAAMRQSFHHPALTTCGAPLPPGKKYVAVRYLTKELIYFVVDVKGKGQEIFEDACKYLGLQDMEFFGLAFLQDDEYIFVDPNLKVSKYAVKSWKTTDHGTGSDGQPLLLLYLRVKHYVDCHLLISEKVARHQYYLQLQDNVRRFSQTVSEEKFFVLAALALQADMGNYSSQRHKGRYFDIGNYFPAWIILKVGEDFIVRNIPGLHKDNTGLSRGEAQVGYIKEASDATSQHNLHFYKMQRRKGKSLSSVWLGISDSGLHIYEQQESEKTKSLLSTFLWCDIAKLHFERKKFEILSEGSPECRKFTYYVNNEELAKNLLSLCRSTHHFHMSNEARVQDLKKLQLDGGKFYRESYIYTDEVDLAQQTKQNKLQARKNSRYHCPSFNRGVRCWNESSTFAPCERRSKHRSVLRLNSDAGNRTVPKSMNRSMENLPYSNGHVLSPDVRYKSQSIACFSDRLLAPGSVFAPSGVRQLWNPASSNNLSATPTATLFSQSSCTSCTDSACSSLSLASGSTVKASTLNISSKKHLNDSKQWVKCDSFEELSVDRPVVDGRSLPHKICISTFKDSHVRTASLYDAAGLTAKNGASTFGGRVLPTTSRTASPKLKHRAHSVSQVCLMSSAKSSCSPPIAVVGKAPAGRNVAHAPSARRQHESSTSRTATRIGVSSLSREQRLPLTLFNAHGKMTACGSEPNLHNSLFDCDGSKLTDFTMLRDSVQNRITHGKKPNSRSEMCLNVIGQSSAKLCHLNFAHNNPSMVDCNRIAPEGQTGDNSSGEASSNGCEDFPCILPPLAYRNSSDDLHSTSAMSSSMKKKENDTDSSPSASTPDDLSSSTPPTPDVLDIRQLLQKSHDLDLPLISALCNDRSLLMLPKTVPTCSRQRHLGSKDPLRFARGYSTTPTSGHLSDLVGSIGRPATWHVESSTSTPWYGDHQGGMWYHAPAGANHPQNLPPTILTSFGKTPEKCNPLTSSPYQSSDYRLNKLQMIPTKLLSGIVPNGKIHLKGSSS